VQPTALVWFRQDLRLADNPALLAAVESGAHIVPVYIWSPDEEGGWGPGAASRWWLHRSLQALDASLRERGSQLLLRCGPTQATLLQLARETGSTMLYFNRRYEPAAQAIENSLRDTLPGAGVAVHSSQSALLREPWELRTGGGGPIGGGGAQGVTTVLVLTAAVARLATAGCFTAAAALAVA